MMPRAVMVLVVVLALAAPSADAAMRGTVMSRDGMVSSAHPIASMVGVGVLRSGGNAMDAAIAMAAVLNVVDPAMTGIGGDMFLLYHSARDGKVSSRKETDMPNITIQWYAGRTPQQKRELTAAITDAMVKIGKTTADQVHIVFQDIEKSNWGHNGKLASD